MESQAINQLDDSRPPSRLIIVVIFLAAFAIRAWGLDIQSLSNDEIIEIEDARLSISEVIFSPDGFPPLYRLLLALISVWFPHEFTGRWLSVIVGALTLAPVMAFTWRISGRIASIFAGILFAVSPFFVHYSQEARPYALFILCSASSMYWLHRAMTSDAQRDWLGFSTSSVLGGYLHYYMALVVAAAGLAWVVDRAILREKFQRGLIHFSLVGGLCSPLVLLLPSDFSFSEYFPAEVGASVYSAAYTYFSFLSGFAFGPSISELHDFVDSPSQAVWAMLPAIVGSSLLLALPMFYGFWSLRHERRAILITLAYATVPVGLATFLSAFFQLNYNVRHVVASAVPCLLMAAVGISRYQFTASGLFHNEFRTGRPILKIVPVVLLIFSTVWLTAGTVRRLTMERYLNEDVKSAAAWLMQNAGDQTAYVISDYMARTLDYYNDGRVRIRRFPNVEKVMQFIDSPEDLESALQNVEKIEAGRYAFWLVMTRPFHGDPKRIMRDWLSTSQHVKLSAQFHGIDIYECTFSADMTSVGMRWGAGSFIGSVFR